MPNQVRFTQLVKASGRPHSATLWLADPAKDPEFKKAIAENRILTIHHVNVGPKKESGEIGFDKSAGASYLIFPKSLPLAKSTRVIGLKFNLLDEPEVKDPVQIKPAPKRPKIEHVKTIKTPEPNEVETKPLPTKKREPKTAKPSKREAKTKTAHNFKVTIDFTAAATCELEVAASNATEAIDTALKQAETSPPKPDWKIEATTVKRCD
jgi:hypothetical protein